MVAPKATPDEIVPPDAGAAEAAVDAERDGELELARILGAQIEVAVGRVEERARS
jgi:hypothetical protein